jgi:hypothetical protein
VDLAITKRHKKYAYELYHYTRYLGGNIEQNGYGKKNLPYNENRSEHKTINNNSLIVRAIGNRRQTYRF